MTKRLLVDAQHPEETRVIIANDHLIEEYDFITAAKEQIKGNIYLAKVTRVEPSLQAAFVEYGGGKQGFLSFSEINPDYYQIPIADRKKLLEEAAQAREEELNARRARDKDRAQEREASEDSEEASSSEEDSESEESTAAEEGFEGIEAPKPFTPPVHIEETPEEAAAADASEEQFPVEPVEEDRFAAPVLEESSETEEGSDEEGDAQPRDASEGESAEGDAEEGEENTGDSPRADGEGRGERGGRRGRGRRGRGRRRPGASEARNGGMSTSSDVIDGEEGDEGPRPAMLETASDEDDIEDQKDLILQTFRRRYKIQEVIKRGQILLVQVIKDERGNKGASLTTYISLAGRYCVLMPNSSKDGGISRKIARGEDRKRLKKVASEMRETHGMSVIIRTAGIDRTKVEIKRDYEYLIKLWNTIREGALAATAPALIYVESDIIKRSLRDYYSPDIEEVLIQGEDAFKSAKEFMKLIMPSHAAKVKQFKEKTPIFSEYNLDAQLHSMYQPIVKLRSGGYIVINHTEALIAIDVNSGRSTTERNVEETALKTNLEAAGEVARQLRLRDLGGLIVVDFIDMFYGKNRRSVERAFKDAMKVDRAKIQVGHISPFGLLELSRQRLRPSISETSTSSCQHCQGTGFVRSLESLAIEIIRILEKDASGNDYRELRILVSNELALHMLNHTRSYLTEVEQQFGISLTITADAKRMSTDYSIERIRKTHGSSESGEGQRGDGERKPRRDRDRDRGRGGRDRDRGRGRDENRPEGQESAPAELQDASVEPVEGAEGETSEENASRPLRGPRGERGGARRGRRGGRGRGGSRNRTNEDGSPIEPSATESTGGESSSDSAEPSYEAPAAASSASSETIEYDAAPVKETPKRAPRRTSAAVAAAKAEKAEKMEREKAGKADKDAPAVALVADKAEEKKPRARGKTFVETDEAPANASAPQNDDPSRPKKGGWWRKMVD